MLRRLIVGVDYYLKRCFFLLLVCLLPALIKGQLIKEDNGGIKRSAEPRQRININKDWKFMRYSNEPDSLIYDVRPEVTDRNDKVVADSKPTEAI